MKKKVFLALSLLTLPYANTAVAECPIKDDMVTWALIVDKVSKLKWFKEHPDLVKFCSAYVLAGCLYDPATQSWGPQAWAQAKKEGILSEAMVNAAFSAAAMATLGLLTVKAGVGVYKSVRVVNNQAL